jgi:hypothetical protein
MFRNFSQRIAALAAVAMSGIGGFEHQLKSGRYTNKLGNHTGFRKAADGRQIAMYDGTGRNGTTMFYPNGAKERARRMRQIARGQLTASNGLVRGAHFPKVNSHGRVVR